MGSVTCSQPMDLNFDWCCFYYFVRNSLVSLLEALCVLCVTRGGDLWTMRLWLHVLAGTILHHKMYTPIVHSIANSWRYRTSCCRVICGALLQICSLPTRCPPRRDMCRYVRHSQDFPPRAQCMYEKHFHNAKSWPLCCISPAPAPSAIALGFGYTPSSQSV